MSRPLAMVVTLGLCLARPGAGTPGGEVAGSSRPTVRALIDAGARGIALGDYTAAEACLRRALADSERRQEAFDLDTARLLNLLGMVDKYTARFDEGRAAYLRARAIVVRRGGDPGLLADIDHNLGGLEHARGRFAAGEPFARQGLALRERIPGADDADLAADRAALAALLDGQGRYAEAEALYAAAIRAFEGSPGPPRIELAVSLNNLAAIHQARGRTDRAEAGYRRALALKERMLPPGHPDLATTLNNLAALRRRQGRRGEAARLYRRALAILESALGKDHPSARKCRANYTRLVETTRRPDWRTR